MARATDAEERSRQATEPLLVAEQLLVRLAPERSVRLDLRLQPGAMMQVSGPSGAGKSTVLRALARLHPCGQGRLCLAGEAAIALSPRAWRRQVVYLPQNPVMVPGTVADNLALGSRAALAPRPRPDWRPRARQLLQQVGLAGSDEQLGRQAKSLSGGESARVALVRALLVEPRVLLADEVTAALDRGAAIALTSLLHSWVEGGRGVVLAAHDDAPWRALRPERVELEPVDD